ncbi:MAG: hypothetical protein M0033_13215 [Nitrospiraceae bacterium]|nr:hypothetical protein [Nitrospiraceae bacterium]
MACEGRKDSRYSSNFLNSQYFGKSISSVKDAENARTMRAR